MVLPLVKTQLKFPFLFGGTFIEGRVTGAPLVLMWDFPSFSEGLSLRACRRGHALGRNSTFPFLFGGTFIEGCSAVIHEKPLMNFPSFSEGLSLRANPG